MRHRKLIIWNILCEAKRKELTEKLGYAALFASGKEELKMPYSDVNNP